MLFLLTGCFFWHPVCPKWCVCGPIFMQTFLLKIGRKKKFIKHPVLHTKSIHSVSVESWTYSSFTVWTTKHIVLMFIYKYFDICDVILISSSLVSSQFKLETKMTDIGSEQPNAHN